MDTLPKEKNPNGKQIPEHIFNLLVVREIQMKASMIYHQTPTRMAKF